MRVRNGILKGEIKGGKLIKCSIKLKEGKIEKIEFTGDFFMHPEEKIEELEEKLKGVEFNQEKIRKVIFDFFEEVEIIGVTKEDFLEVIKKAKKVL